MIPCRSENRELPPAKFAGGPSLRHQDDLCPSMQVKRRSDRRLIQENGLSAVGKWASSSGRWTGPRPRWARLIHGLRACAPPSASASPPTFLSRWNGEQRMCRSITTAIGPSAVTSILSPWGRTSPSAGLSAYDHFANSYVLKPVDYDQFVTAALQLGLYWMVLNAPPPRKQMTVTRSSSARLGPEAL